MDLGRKVEANNGTPVPITVNEEDHGEDTSTRDSPGKI
jgi:hypothetical protein